MEFHVQHDSDKISEQPVSHDIATLQSDVAKLVRSGATHIEIQISGDE